MSPIFDFLFSQYAEYETHQIILEAIAVLFGLASALFSWRNSIWVYPTGIVSTAIFVYLLWQWGLLGDLMIQGYYFSMSIYGWYVWTRKVSPDKFTPITYATKKEHATAVLIGVSSILLVFLVYTFFEKWNRNNFYRQLLVAEGSEILKTLITFQPFLHLLQPSMIPTFPNLRNLLRLVIHDRNYFGPVFSNKWRGRTARFEGSAKMHSLFIMTFLTG